MVAIFFVIIVVTFYLNAFRQPYISHPKKAEMSETELTSNLDRSYFVDTPGCRMPSFPVMSEKIQEHFRYEKPIVCKRPMTVSNDTHIWFALTADEMETEYNVTDTNKLLCQMHPIERKSDFDVSYLNNYSFMLYGQVVKVDEEQIRINCTYDFGEKPIYVDYHYFIFPEINYLYNHIDEIDLDLEYEDLKKIVIDELPNVVDSSRMNVLVFGLDAVSRLNFNRQLNKTLDLILSRLDAIEMFGYNKVEDNTYPNLIPVLAGLDVDELDAHCLPNGTKSTFDDCHFVWQDYRDRNYTTVFAEDVAKLGLFNYAHAGFEQQPTDYCLRPIIRQMEENIAEQKMLNSHMCMGGRRTVDVLIDYAQRFVRAIRNNPYFAFFWAVTYSHDYINLASIIDQTMVDFVNGLADSNALNNTMFILMSDHGIRWGPFRSTYQGGVEERLPMLYFMPPKWFTAQYPEAVANLRANRHKLTTPFDLHETLQDLVRPDKTIATEAIKRRTMELKRQRDIGNKLPRGISLFLPVPESRTCSQAAITPHWCTCHDTEELPVTDERVQKAADFIVAEMNQELVGHTKCARLELNRIKDGNLGVSSDGIRNENGTSTFVDVSVRLQTRPGLGEFEATVRMFDDAAGQPDQLAGTISRTNLYGNQSHCVDEYKLKLYCFCDTN